MSEKSPHLNTMFQACNESLRPNDRRAAAVAAALQLIEARCEGNHVDLAAELNNLSAYADLIQEALRQHS